MCVWTEEIPSDEDEVNENRNAMQQQCSMPTGQGGEDDDEDEDDYWDDDGFEGTPLEEYSTPLDYDNGEDEYQFFTAALLSKSVLKSLYGRCMLKEAERGSYFLIKSLFCLLLEKLIRILAKDFIATFGMNR